MAAQAQSTRAARHQREALAGMFKIQARMLTADGDIATAAALLARSRAFRCTETAAVHTGDAGHA